MSFCDLLQIEDFSTDCDAAGVIQWLAEAGRAGRFVHNVQNGASQWECLCALEEALVDAKQNDGWEFVVGVVEGDDETHGWLERDGCIVLPYGPERKKHGSDLGIFTGDEFVCAEWASTPCADDSGIHLNKALKQGFFIDASLGAQGW